MFNSIKKILGIKPTKRPIQSFTPSTSGEIKELLRSGSIHFAFKRKDGVLRIAHGTTNLGMIPRSQHPQGIKPASAKTVPFFDLEAKSWKSMSASTECFVY